MSQVKLFLDKRIDKNGEVIIYALVHLNYKSIKINTGIKTLPDKWDKENSKIKGKAKIIRDQNLIISKMVSDINEVFVKYRLRNKKLSIAGLKAELENPNEDVNAFEILDAILEKKKRDIAFGTHKLYKNSIRWFKLYNDACTCSDLSVEYLENFYDWMKGQKKIGTNGIHAVLKNLGVLLNEMKRKGYIEINPLQDIKIKKAAVHIEYLTIDELKKIQDFYDSGEGPRNLIQGARHFLFMCYTGIRVSDFIALTEQNLLNQFTLRFIPLKTANCKPVPIEVPLTRYARKLIKDENSDTGYLFNTKTRLCISQRAGRIAAHLNINKRVTNHVARHTFATTFLSKTNDIVTCQKILGHSDIQTTMRYVHVTRDTIIKRMAEYEAELFENEDIKKPDPESVKTKQINMY